MYCYLCGKKARIAQKVVSYEEDAPEAVSVHYTHCERQWIIDDKGIITACGTVEAKKGTPNADKKTPQA